MQTIKLFIIIACCFLVNLTFGQNPKTIKVAYYYPKDSIRFNKEVPTDFGYNYQNESFGKTTMIIHCESAFGHFELLFKKKIFKLSRIINYKKGSVGEVFNFKNRKWEHETGTWNHSDMTEKPIDTNVYSEHNLYALILLHDHGTEIEKLKFQDFGNEVYWPEFDYANCSISDEDKDGMPEFYLSYMGESDGLDAKPYKQIIYTQTPKTKATFIKSKATAFYPAGNEEDVYRVEYDSNWKTLPQAIQQKSNNIIKKHKQQ